MIGKDDACDFMHVCVRARASVCVRVNMHVDDGSSNDSRTEIKEGVEGGTNTCD
jgi:hypothetical protein